MAGPAEVRAELTGMVWKVLVKPGDNVEEEQTLIILESMKMEIPVVAPRAGVVKEVLTEEGAAVEEGKVLVVLE
jgi:biotin carboxyl carrier protein